MEIKSIVTRFSTNTYLLSTNDYIIIVDPGGSDEEILNALSIDKNKSIYVLLTHGHYDHVLCCASLKILGATIYMSSLDDFLINDEIVKSFFPLKVNGFEYIDIKDCDFISIFNKEIKILKTPGHTPGSVCYIIDDIMFSGDTIFKGTIGRTDLPKSDKVQMLQSLKKIKDLADDYKVLPGHGSATTLCKEKQSNPYLK